MAITLSTEGLVFKSGTYWFDFLPRNTFFGVVSSNKSGSDLQYNSGWEVGLHVPSCVFAEPSAII